MIALSCSPFCAEITSRCASIVHDAALRFFKYGFDPLNEIVPESKPSQDCKHDILSQMPFQYQLQTGFNIFIFSMFE